MGKITELQERMGIKQSEMKVPLIDFENENDILKYASALIVVTKGNRDNDDYWVTTERFLFHALIGYLHYEASPEEKTINTLSALIKCMLELEFNEQPENAVDLMFKDLENKVEACSKCGHEQKQPKHFVQKHYIQFRRAAGHTAKSILLSCSKRVSCITLGDLGNLKELYYAS